jgi:hypothetical protein
LKSRKIFLNFLINSSKAHYCFSPDCSENFLLFVSKRLQRKAGRMMDEMQPITALKKYHDMLSEKV